MMILQVTHTSRLYQYTCPATRAHALLQAWIPAYLGTLGVGDLSSVGLLSALPWLVRSKDDDGCTPEHGLHFRRCEQWPDMH